MSDNKPEEKMEEGSNSSESSNEDDVENIDQDSDDDNIDAEIELLETATRKSPYVYDNHIQLIKLCRRSGELEKLRSARRTMTKYFPLTPELWLEWLKDEKNLVETEEDRKALRELYSSSVKDYLSVELWVERCTFAMEGLESEGAESVVHLLEEALSNVGLHVTKGCILWETYREFELAILAGLQRDLVGSVGNKELEEKIVNQNAKINALFKRQLKIPLLDMETTYEEYKLWIDKEETEVDADYKKALNALEQVIMPFEEKLESAKEESEEASLEAYLAYLNFELGRKDLKRIVCLFERAITDHCLRAELWVKYSDFLEANLPYETNLMPFFGRAVRNCPWSVELWVRYAEAAELFEKDHDFVKGIFEASLGGNFTEREDYLRIWTSYCDYMRRRLMKAEEDDKETALNSLRGLLERAIAHLIQFFNIFGDPQCILYRYWAHIEAKYASNMEKARTIWADVMKLDHGNEASMWLEYFNFERCYGDTKHCRRVLGRALNSVTDLPEAIFEACVRYEREEGSLESLREVVRKVEAQRKRLAERAEKNEATEKGKGKGRQHQKQQQQQEEQKVSPRGKKRPMEDIPKDRRGGKKQAVEFVSPSPAHSQPVVKDKDGFTVPSLAPKSSAHHSVADENGAAKTNVTEGPKPRPVPHDHSKDYKTVFVSNLAYTTKDAAIKQALSSCGEMKEIRIVYDYKGRSKGFAYVEFDNSAGAQKALTMDRTPVENRPMYVSECDPAKRHQFNFPVGGLEKCKLFVKNLPKTVTRQALETIFGQHGHVKDIRIATFRNGTPKGHAYIEYSNEDDASRAIIKTDDLLVGENRISVALSNPPVRGQGFSGVPTLGGGRRDRPDHSRPHIQVALVPRALQTKPSTGPSHSDTTPTAKKSNEDFRKMFQN